MKLGVIALLILLVGAAPATFTPDTRAAVLDAIDRAVNNYTFSNLVPQLHAALAEHRAEYLAVDDPKTFASDVTEGLYAVAHDKHLKVFYDEVVFPSTGKTAPDRTELKAEISKTRNFGFSEALQLPGNIGYVAITGFDDMPQTKTTIDAAMAFLANTDALMIDLRQNGGGVAGSIDYLMGYFLRNPTELTTLVFSAPGQQHTDRQFSAASVDGERYLGKPIYILTSSHTFSAGEQFAYDMKVLRLATIVGEPTGGGANPGRFFNLDHNFAVFVPLGHAVNPYTHTNWEGVGVQPDVATAADGALLTAYTAALKASTNQFPPAARSRAEALQNPAAALAKSLPN
jgi:hypothetical protein